MGLIQNKNYYASLQLVGKIVRCCWKHVGKEHRLVTKWNLDNWRCREKKYPNKNVTSNNIIETRNHKKKKQ